MQRPAYKKNQGVLLQSLQAQHVALQSQNARLEGRLHAYTVSSTTLPRHEKKGGQATCIYRAQLYQDMKRKDQNKGKSLSHVLGDMCIG
jgi:hypothetical protein